MARETERPELTVIIPVVERHGDLERLFLEYSNEVRRTGHSAEFIFVIDRRQEETLPVLRRIQEESEEDILLFLLGGNFGESTALSLGIEKARGDLIATVASYFQVDPQGLAQAVRLVDSGDADVVVGCRYPRVDSLFNRAQTRLFHSFVGALTRTSFQDLSCGFRVMRTEVARELRIYGGLHRFLPILAHSQGFNVKELLLRQHRDDTATRYYGVALYLKRLLDILTVYFIAKFTRRPLRFFGVLGLLLAVPGVLLTAYLGIYRLFKVGGIADRPLLLLAVLFIVIGFQSLSLGLIGEVIIFTHARRLGQYRVVEVIKAPDLDGVPSTRLDSEKPLVPDIRGLGPSPDTGSSLAVTRFKRGSPRG